MPPLPCRRGERNHSQSRTSNLSAGAPEGLLTPLSAQMRNIPSLRQSHHPSLPSSLSLSFALFVLCYFLPLEQKAVSVFRWLKASFFFISIHQRNRRPEAASLSLLPSLPRPFQTPPVALPLRSRDNQQNGFHLRPQAPRSSTEGPGSRDSFEFIRRSLSPAFDSW